MMAPGKIVTLANDILAVSLNKDRTLNITFRDDDWLYQFSALKLCSAMITPVVTTPHECSKMEVAIGFEAVKSPSGDFGTVMAIPKVIQPKPKRRKKPKAARKRKTKKR